LIERLGLLSGQGGDPRKVAVEVDFQLSLLVRPQFDAVDERAQNICRFAPVSLAAATLPAHPSPIHIEGSYAMNEKIIDEIEDDISDEALEAGGTRAEVLAAWTILCTSSIQCNYASE